MERGDHATNLLDGQQRLSSHCMQSSVLYEKALGFYLFTEEVLAKEQDAV